MKLPVLPVVPVIDESVIKASVNDLIDRLERYQLDRLWCHTNLGAPGDRWNLQDGGGIVIYREEDRILFELSR